MRSGKAKLMLVSAAAGLWLAGVAEGSSVGISYVSQDRSVSATSLATAPIRGGTSDASMTDQESHSQQAGGFGGFAGSASAVSNVGPDNAQASASASQQSTLGSSGFSASGAVRADSNINLGGPAVGTASSVFHITFDVTQAESYTFAASLNSSNDFANPTSDSVKIALADSGGNNLFAPITSINLSGFDASGTLAAGTYSLTMDVSATSADQASNFVNYDISLTDGPVGVTQAPGDGTTPSAVPLPTALTNSLVMLSGLGIVALVRRRIANWAQGSMMRRTMM